MSRVEEPSNEAIIEKFVHDMNRLDWDAVYALMRQDIVYHNMPFPPLHGLEAVKAFFGAVGRISDCRWRITHIAAKGDVVLTERVDDFSLDGRQISLPVMGVFELRGGRIAAWRDYFDRQSFEQQLGRPLG